MHWFTWQQGCHPNHSAQLPEGWQAFREWCGPLHVSMSVTKHQGLRPQLADCVNSIPREADPAGARKLWNFERTNPGACQPLARARAFTA